MFNLNTEAISEALSIMVRGMVGIFAVCAVIIVVVMLLNHLTSER